MRSSYHKTLLCFSCSLTSQSLWEFAKSRAIRVMCASVVYVPTCQTCPNFLFLRANVPKVCQMCVKFSNIEILRGISILYYYIKNSTLYLISQYYSYIYIHHNIKIICKNCILLYFYTSCHINEKCAKLLFFETFLFFS